MKDGNSPNVNSVAKRMFKFIKISVLYQQYILEMILYVPATARKQFKAEEKKRYCKNRQRKLLSNEIRYFL